MSDLLLGTTEAERIEYADLVHPLVVMVAVVGAVLTGCADSERTLAKL
jgi:hypothetical protein